MNEGSGASLHSDPRLWPQTGLNKVWDSGYAKSSANVRDNLALAAVRKAGKPYSVAAGSAQELSHATTLLKGKHWPLLMDLTSAGSLYWATLTSPSAWTTNPSLHCSISRNLPQSTITDCSISKQNLYRSGSAPYTLRARSMSHQTLSPTDMMAHMPPSMSMSSLFSPMVARFSPGMLKRCPHQTGCPAPPYSVA